MKRADSGHRLNPARAIVFSVLLPLSLILTATTNRIAGQVLSAAAPSIDWIATAAIPSFLIIAGLYAWLGDRRFLSLPPAGPLLSRSVVGLAIGWLCLWLGGCILSAIIAGHWLIYARGVPLVAAFLVFGPLGEELLFRGLIFENTRAIWPSSVSMAIVVSTVAFSLHHMSLHTAPRGLAMAQLIFTIPMGVVFALLRERTGSLWPGLWLHTVTNLTSVL